MSKKISIVIVLVIVLLAVVGLWALKRPARESTKPKTGTSQPTPTPNPKSLLPFKVQETPVDQLPDGFIKGFPLEKDATVITNQSANTAMGLQTSRTFVSKKTTDENYKIYSDYFKQNKWTIVTSANTSDFKAISAKNSSGATVDLTISVNSVTKNVEVSIVFMQPVKK